MEQVCAPLLERVMHNTEQLSVLSKHDLDYKHRVTLLETIVLKKNEKDDAFERIH